MCNNIEEFLTFIRIEKGLSYNTIISYRLDLQQFIKFLTQEKISYINITRKNVLDYIFILNEKSTSSRTQSRKISCLRHFFSFLLTEGKIAYNPFSNIDNPKTEKKLPQVLTIEEVDNLFTVAMQDTYPEKYRSIVILELLYGLGLRISELLSLEQKSIRYALKNQILTVMGKGKKERIFPLSPISIKSIKDYQKVISLFGSSKVWFFPSKRKDKPLSRQRVFQIIKKLSYEAGFNFSTISPHSLRHTFASHLVQNGANLMVVQKLLGHKDIATTELYTHLNEKQCFECVEDFHPLSKKKIQG